MRLNEKTIELNFCSQMLLKFGHSLIWFGLTQRQEAKLGFDACTELGGRMLFFQFKASVRLLSSGDRRFNLPHAQLVRLRALASRFPRCVFYVFPLLGTVAELARNPDVVAQSWLLDVGLMPPVAPPTTRTGTLRKNSLHNADVRPGTAILHSEPTQVELVSAATFAESRFSGSDGINRAFESFEAFWEFAQIFKRNAVGCVTVTRPAPSGAG